MNSATAISSGAPAAAPQSVGAQLPAPAGAGRRVLMLLSNAFDPDPRVAAEASSLVAHGYQVTILAWDRDRKRPKEEEVGAIRIRRVFTKSTHGRGAAQAIVMPLVFGSMLIEARHLKFDAVHAHDFDMLPLGFLLARLRRVPLIYDSHEHYISMLHGSIPSWLAGVIYGFESVLMRHGDLTITVGNKLHDVLVSRGSRSTVVVGNWKLLSEYRLCDPIRRQIRRQLNIPEDALALCFIANLGRERHIAELVQALIERPSVHLIIGGTGPEAEMVTRAAARNTNIHFLGYVHPRDISRYTMASDVLFYGFDLANPNAQYSAPNKLFEALAAGKPMISGHFGEIESIINQNQCGVLVPRFTVEEIGAAIDRCADRSQLRVWGQRAAAAGQHEFNWEIAETRLLNAYAELFRDRSVR